MDVTKYLLRIGFNHPTEPTLEVLRSLHSFHLLAVPFENLALHCGGLLSPDLHAVYDKIVNQRRGGLCYENNGLFSWLLSKLGFEVTILSGQVKNAITGCYGPPFDHLISVVSLRGRRWLCDVGFGSAGFSVPLSLDAWGEPQTTGQRVYRVREEGDQRFLEWRGEPGRVTDGEWKGIYKFTLEPRRREDFTAMCDYHQSSPSSIFFCKSVCTLLQPDGRLTLVGRTLTTTTSRTDESALKTSGRTLTDEEIPVVLEKMFGVVLPSPLITKDEDVLPPSVEY
ncbi:unnamed protein product [Arctogadus glacialis]